MVKRAANGKTKQSSQQKSTKGTSKPAPVKRAQAEKKVEKVDVSTEHYYDERTRTRAAEIGDLAEETLDPHAPYNRTYGIRSESRE